MNLTKYLFSSRKNTTDKKKTEDSDLYLSSVYLEFPFLNLIQVFHALVCCDITIVPAQKLIKEVINDYACAFLHHIVKEFFKPRLFSFFLFLLFIGHYGFSPICHNVCPSVVLKCICPLDYLRPVKFHRACNPVCEGNGHSMEWVFP